MTVKETIKARMKAIRDTRNMAARGIVLGIDIHTELSADLQWIYVYDEDKTTILETYETYLGLEISTSHREGTLVIY